MTTNQIKRIATNIRKHKKTSFEKLAVLAKMPFPTLEKIIFCQIKDVKISTLSKIARALSVTVDDLLK